MTAETATREVDPRKVAGGASATSETEATDILTASCARETPVRTATGPRTCSVQRWMLAPTRKILVLPSAMFRPRPWRHRLQPLALCPTVRRASGTASRASRGQPQSQAQALASHRRRPPGLLENGRRWVRSPRSLPPDQPNPTTAQSSPSALERSSKSPSALRVSSG